MYGVGGSFVAEVNVFLESASVHEKTFRLTSLNIDLVFLLVKMVKDKIRKYEKRLCKNILSTS